MVKIVLEIFLCVGIVVIYILMLIVTTMILVKIWGMEDPDDFDYAMTANVIQFFVIVMAITNKVVQWIP